MRTAKTNRDLGLSYMYPLKGHIERVLGHREFQKVKEFTSIPTWAGVLKKLFSCYRNAIGQSITVCTEEFKVTTEHIIARAMEGMTRPHKNIEELLAQMVSLQSELIFAFTGHVEDRTAGASLSLRSGWNLSKYRSTQIVQTKKQRLNYIQHIAWRYIPREKIEQLAAEYRKVKHKESFWEWILTKLRPDRIGNVNI